jgi:hypothetical protein
MNELNNNKIRESTVLSCTHLQSVLFHQPPVALLESLAHVHQLDAGLDETLRVPSDLSVRYTTPHHTRK